MQPVLRAPFTAPVRARGWPAPTSTRSSRPGASCSRERPRTRAELARGARAALAGRRPGRARARGHVQHCRSCRSRRAASGAAAGRRAGRSREAVARRASSTASAAVDDVVLRYLAAFGPATVADMRMWSGSPACATVLERLRPRLRTFRDERGRELFDVPDGAAARPRRRPRRRASCPSTTTCCSPTPTARGCCSGSARGCRGRAGRWIGTLLVDGFFRAYWRHRGRRATLTIDRFAPQPDDPAGTLDAIVAEGERLLDFVAPEGERGVRFVPEP